jgi:hypothetical protein
MVIFHSFLYVYQGVHTISSLSEVFLCSGPSCGADLGVTPCGAWLRGDQVPFRHTHKHHNVNPGFINHGLLIRVVFHVFPQ